MEEYVKKGKWTSQEIKLRKILENLGLKLKKDFFHNYKLQNSNQTGYYSLDFLLPKQRLVIEINGSLWHEYLDGVKEKDLERDKWLNNLGFQVLRIKSEEIDRNPLKIKKLLLEKVKGSLEIF